MTTSMLLIIVLVVLLFGGVTVGPAYQWGTPHYSGLGLVLLVLLILLLTGRIK